MAIELKPHQEKVLHQIRNGSILNGGTGTGKTITALTYFVEKVCGGRNRVGEPLVDMKQARDILVFTTVKKRDDLDWQKEAAWFGIGGDEDASWGGVKITVDSWNNIAKYQDVKGYFIIFDEQRLVGNGAWVKAFHKMAKNNLWILLSATPGDSWIEFAPVFVAHDFFKSRAEFIEKHVIYKRYSKFPKIEKYYDTGPLIKMRRQVLVDMPYDRHTKRHEKHLIVHHDKARFDEIHKKRWHVFEERPLKDVGEMFAVMRQLVNRDPDRLATVMKLSEQHPRLIVFYNFNFELDMLRTLAGTLGIESAEWNGHKHEPVPTGDRWLYLVQYTAGNEGWNCITTDAMVFYSLNYSYKVNEQCKGRIDRLNTPFVDLYYYYLRSNSFIDGAIMKALKLKKNFNLGMLKSAWELAA